MRLAIAHLIGHLDAGGAERQVVNLLNAVADSGPTLILTGTGHANDLLSALDSRVNVERVPCRLSRLPFDVRRISRIVRSRNINVLHSHMFWPNLYGALVAASAGVPVFVTTEHGRNPWKRPWHHWLERRVISRIAKRRICVSDDIRSIRMKEDGLPESQLQIIPNGTTIGVPAAPPSNSTPSLLAVGRLVEAKDYGTLLAAMRYLGDRGVPVSLRIAGDGPLRGSLESECVRLGLQSQVQFLGNRKDVARLLAEADVFVMSSRREGQPLALLEAMAAEKPIVATAVGGVPGTVSDGVEAILVPPGDAESLATALQRVLKEPGRAAALGRNARDRATKSFSIEAVAADHLRLYGSLLAEDAS